MAGRFETIDAYIAAQRPDIQPTLERVRQAIQAGAPGTDEAISYGIPTFKWRGRYVIYFAAWKDHLSVYPIPELDDAIRAEVDRYRAAKGTLRFPYAEPIPYGLIERLAALHLAQRTSSAG
jgi:uncharacterized protein YdhG (YjbR/CyaY superfamily)